MPKPHPMVLGNLLERYESLEAQVRDAGQASPELVRELQDTAYTLCVSTGTRDVEAAREAARRLLAESFAATAAAAAAQPPTVAA